MSAKLTSTYDGHDAARLKLDTDVRGTLRLYVYTFDKKAYVVRQYFANKIRFPDEEWLTSDAKQMAEHSMKLGHEVRITNGGDNLVFHAEGAEIFYPPEGWYHFWKKVEKK